MVLLIVELSTRDLVNHPDRHLSPPLHGTTPEAGEIFSSDPEKWYPLR